MIERIVRIHVPISIYYELHPMGDVVLISHVSEFDDVVVTFG